MAWNKVPADRVHRGGGVDVDAAVFFNHAVEYFISNLVVGNLERRKEARRCEVRSEMEGAM